MTENMKNIIVLIEPSEQSYNTNWKIANLYLNRFTIDEDAAFELLGVYYLKKCHEDFVNQPEEFRVQRKEKVTVMNSNTVKKKAIISLSLVSLRGFTPIGLIYPLNVL